MVAFPKNQIQIFVAAAGGDDTDFGDSATTALATLEEAIDRCHRTRNPIINLERGGSYGDGLDYQINDGGMIHFDVYGPGAGFDTVVNASFDLKNSTILKFIHPFRFTKSVGAIDQPGPLFVVRESSILNINGLDITTWTPPSDPTILDISDNSLVKIITAVPSGLAPGTNNVINMPICPTSGNSIIRCDRSHLSIDGNAAGPGLSGLDFIIDGTNWNLDDSIFNLSTFSQLSMTVGPFSMTLNNNVTTTPHKAILANYNSAVSITNFDAGIVGPPLNVTGFGAGLFLDGAKGSFPDLSGVTGNGVGIEVTRGGRAVFGIAPVANTANTATTNLKTRLQGYV